MPSSKVAGGVAIGFSRRLAGVPPRSESHSAQSSLRAIRPPACTTGKRMYKPIMF